MDSNNENKDLNECGKYEISWYCFEKDLVWIRFGKWGYGIHFTCRPKLYSEIGKKKYYYLPFGWRKKFLKKV